MLSTKILKFGIRYQKELHKSTKEKTFPFIILWTYKGQKFQHTENWERHIDFGSINFKRIKISFKNQLKYSLLDKKKTLF